MAATPTSEARELSLLDKVELRIALAQSDAALETSLKTYLAPVLLKLASDHVAVRNKVNMKNHGTRLEETLLTGSGHLDMPAHQHKTCARVSFFEKVPCGSSRLTLTGLSNCQFSHCSSSSRTIRTLHSSVILT